MKETLHKEIEETLVSFDGMQRAEANPFLAAKIRHRLQAAAEEPLVSSRWSWRLAVVMIIFLVLNFITVQMVRKDKEDVSGANAIATDYSISLPQAY